MPKAIKISYMKFLLLDLFLEMILQQKNNIGIEAIK
jgi:hypothetical protein